MSLGLKCYEKNKNKIKRIEKMSPEFSPDQNWNDTKKSKFLLNWDVTKTEISPKLNCHQHKKVTKKISIRWNVTKTDMSQCLNVSKTQM